MKREIFILSLLVSFATQAKILDKIVAVIDDQVVTQSMLERFKTNILARKNIAPIIYRKNDYAPDEIIDLIFNAKVVRAHLEKQGVLINDEHVESEIKSKEKQLGLSRKEILTFLRNNNVSFEEYFQLSREVIEYQYFLQKIIFPLISVSDQEIKNEYYEINKNNRALSFKYNLVDFYISPAILTKSDLENLPVDLKNFQIKGILPAKLQSVENAKLSDLDSNTLSPIIEKAIKSVNEGDFSRPVEFNGMIHVFYVENRQVGESEDFLENKDLLSRQIRMRKEEKVKSMWFSKESANHYVKKFL